jgi:hypothetical protein
MRLAFSLSLIAVGAVISSNGCDAFEGHACHGGCPVGGESAVFELACNPNDLESVEATGPCSMPDRPLSGYTGAATKWIVSVGSPTPGTCHVTLRFATGFTWSTDVTFATMNDSQPGCAPCPDFVGVASTSNGSKVNNPPETCVALDGGADDASDGGLTDAGADGGME